MVLLVGAFIAGIITVLAPCVLPLLPIIIGGSVVGGVKDRRRPVIITLSLAVSLFVFTLFLKATTVLIAVPSQVLGYVSGGLIVVVGVFMLFPMSYALLLGKLGAERRAQGALATGFRSKRALAGPIIIGAALGPVFSSCSPVYAYIIASILPVRLGQALAYMAAYVLGLCIMLLVIASFGQRAVERLRFAANPRGFLQRTVAVTFILVGLLVLTGYDKRAQLWVSVHTPFNFDAISARFLPKNHHALSNLGRNAFFNVEPYDAPEFVGLQEWINSNPLTLRQLRGKVVLVDFWTYSCINCIRNNAYTERWYETYKKDGFVIVGVHAPEFSFEKIPANVRRGVIDQHLTYPVALDNNLATWSSFQNAYWPAGYLIDAQGKVRRVHEGEGDYAETEQAIRALLQEKGTKPQNSPTTTDSAVPISAQQTPETYLGYARAHNYAGTTPLTAGVRQFIQPDELGINYWALGGAWDVSGESITARGTSTLRFHVAAKDVYMVGGAESSQKVMVSVDGVPISQSNLAGEDVTQSTVLLGAARLYRIASFPQFSSSHIIELQVPTGVTLNAFTFGS